MTRDIVRFAPVLAVSSCVVRSAERPANGLPPIEPVSEGGATLAGGALAGAGVAAAPPQDAARMPTDSVSARTGHHDM